MIFWVFFGSFKPQPLFRGVGITRKISHICHNGMPEQSSRRCGKIHIITSAIKQKSAYTSTTAKDMEIRKMARIFFRFIRFIRIFSFFIIQKVWEKVGICHGCGLWEIGLMPRHATLVLPTMGDLPFLMYQWLWGFVLCDLSINKGNLPLLMLKSSSYGC